MSTPSADFRPLFLSSAIIASLPAALLLGACAATAIESAQDGEWQEFACLAGKGFRAQLGDERTMVTTGTASYVLLRRSSSIGRKYASEDVALMLDDDRAVLVGASGGPFRECRQRRAPAFPVVAP